MMILLVSLRVFLRPGCCMECILILWLMSGRIDAVKSLWICHSKVRRWEYIFWIFSFPRFQKESVSGTDTLLWYRLIALICRFTFSTALGSLMHYMASKALLGSHRFLRHFRLSTLAVTLFERWWSSMYREVLNQPQSHHLAIRYVDNRFVIVQKHHLQTPVLQVFTDLGFFQASRTRTCCADNLLLGLYVDVSTGHSLDSGQCFSQNPPITFERTEESSSVNS